MILLFIFRLYLVSPSRSPLSFNLAAWPTEPFSAVAKARATLGRRGHYPVVWVGIFSFLELLLGQQGLLTMISHLN